MKRIWLGMSLLWGCFIPGCTGKKNAEPQESSGLVRPPQTLTVGEAALNYLMLPEYMMTDFSSKVLPEGVEIVHIDRRRKDVYAAVPKKSGPLWLEMVEGTDVEFGEWDPTYQYVRLENAFLRDSSKVLFRFPFKAFQIDSTFVLEKKFGEVVYQLPMTELRDFVSGAAVYNGPALFVVDSQYTEPMVAANHAAPISPESNTSLTSLVNQLVLPTDSLEQKVQKLLDFVSKEIEYQGHGVYEIFMKSHEVLLSGHSDCSGKVVLYSSLLHQVGIPHLLVYLPGHICVAVPGDFSEENGMFFYQDSVKYTFAETTAPGFVMGESLLEEPYAESDIEFLQVPGATTRVFDFLKKDSLDFAVMWIEVEE